MQLAAMAESVEDQEAHPLGVLVVDDAGAVRNATKWMLEYYGYNTFTAENADLALRQFHDRAADIGLVIVDVRLPDMSADALIRALRRIKPEIRILLVSAYDRDQLDLSLAGFDFMQKPIQFAEIGETVKRLMG